MNGTSRLKGLNNCIIIGSRDSRYGHVQAVRHYMKHKRLLTRNQINKMPQKGTHWPIISYISNFALFIFLALFE